VELDENEGGDDSGVVGDGGNEDEGAGYASRAYTKSKEGGLVGCSKELTALGRSSRETFGEELSESVSGWAAQNSMLIVCHKGADTRVVCGGKECKRGGRCVGCRVRGRKGVSRRPTPVVDRI